MYFSTVSYFLLHCPIRKYHDDHMMSQFENFTWDSVGANRSGDEEEEEEDGRVEMLDSDEEIDTRQIRK